MVNFTGSSATRSNPQEVEDEVIGDEILLKPVIETEWNFSVHVFGERGSDVLRPIRAWASLPQAEEPLRPELTIHEVSQVRNVPDWNGTSWEPRAQVDISLRGLVKDGALVDTIEEYEPLTWTRI